MQIELPSFLPWWLLVGVAIGLVFSVLIAGAFLAVWRLYPSDGGSPSHTEGGEQRKREEIRGYLRTIGEEFREDVPLEGGTVEFYLPARDVAITFDARTYFRIGRTDTYPVLVEHEMPWSHLGARLPFETPTFEFGGGEEEDETAIASPRSAFAVLGLPADASESQVRAAYREKVKRVHPDQGGDREAFREVREAYAVAREHAADGAGRASA